MVTILTLFILVSILFGVPLFRTFLLPRRHRKVSQEISLPLIDKRIVLPKKDVIASHVAQAISFRTISYNTVSKVDWKEFANFRAWMKETYPLVFASLEIKTVAEHNLVLIWKGSDPTLKPVLYIAHMDVVPPEDEAQWTYPPFSGTIADGFVWGRGAIDMKAQLIGIFESFEGLLRVGYQPKRTQYAAFGCDEEVRGKVGACCIAQAFQDEGLQFALLVDEGGAVAENFLAGVTKPAAAIGIAEKGYTDIKLSATCDGGHSSTPKNPTSLGVLGKALGKIEEKQMRASYTMPTSAMIRSLGLEAGFPYAPVFLNTWLLRPLLTFVFSRIPGLNAFIRTTHAATKAQGSSAANVIPKTAEAVVNFRILPDQEINEILSWIQKTVKDPRITTEVLSSVPASRISPVQCPEFELVSAAVREAFPGAIPMPYLMMGATDSKQYEALCDYTYRFTPVRITQNELGRIHDYDERISIENCYNAASFYVSLITHTDKL